MSRQDAVSDIAMQIQCATSGEVLAEDSFLGSATPKAAGGELVVSMVQEPEAEDEAKGWEIVQPLSAEEVRPRALSSVVDEANIGGISYSGRRFCSLPCCLNLQSADVVATAAWECNTCGRDLRKQAHDDLIMGCLDPECDAYFGEGSQRLRCGSCRMYFCERHVVPWRPGVQQRPSGAAELTVPSGGSCSSSASPRLMPSPRSLAPAAGTPAAELLDILGVPTGSAASLCSDCFTVLTPPAGQVSPAVADVASEAKALMDMPLSTLQATDPEEEPSKAVGRALLLRLLERLHTCLRPWKDVEQRWVWSLRDALVEEDPSWLAQFAQQTRWDNPEDAKGLAVLVEKVYNRRKLPARDALQVLGSLGRHAVGASAALGERRLGLIASHAAEAAAGLAGCELACCLELLLDAAEALGATGATGGRRKVVGMLLEAARGSSPDAACLRGELFWALEARASATSSAGSVLVISAGLSSPRERPDAQRAWARVALEELLRGQPADVELGLLRQREWVHNLQRGDLQAARVEPGWGEHRAFPVAVWPPRKRCLGMQGQPRDTSSKNAPVIIRCACLDAADGECSFSGAGSSGAAPDVGSASGQGSHLAPEAAAWGSATGSRSGPQDTTAGLLLKHDTGMHREQQVGQTLRLLERLVWEDEYMKSLLEKEGLVAEDVRTTYVIAMTGAADAIVEFVEGASTLRAVRAGKATSSGGLFASARTERPLLEFLRQHNPDNEEFKKATKRLAFTAAVSAVLSFVAGLGDRHHENFMMTGEGRLLHVDYGYSLGREPFDSVILSYVTWTQRPVATLDFEELVDAVGADYMKNIFWLVVRGAYLRIRQHHGLMLEMVHTAMVRDPARNARGDPGVARAAWATAQAFVSARCVTILPEFRAERFIQALIWHCTRPSVQRGQQIRDDLKDWREVPLRAKAQQAAVKASQGIAATARRAGSAVDGLMEVSTSAKGYFRDSAAWLMQAAQGAEEDEGRRLASNERRLKNFTM